ncbi:MAG: fatty acid desaturase [Pseudomonadota bacterium]
MSNPPSPDSRLEVRPARSRHSWRHFEWPTLLIAIVCYVGWLTTVVCYDLAGPWLSGLLLVILLTLHSSLQHEIIHGHPFRSRQANTLLGSIPLGLLVPFERYRDLHLRHHRDHHLTDPYDDPESNYLPHDAWRGLPRSAQMVLWFNNTLLGRMALGPAISLSELYRQDLGHIRRHDLAVVRAYLWHGLGLVAVGAMLMFVSNMPWWLYGLCAYLAMSVLKIRTYLEHCAFETVTHRTAIVEDRGLLSLLFLNNNLHAVHHRRPGLAWYELPRHYRQHRAAYVKRNNGYVLPSYGFIIRRYLLRCKDPVAHPWVLEENRSSKRAERQSLKVRLQQSHRY